MRLDTLHNRMSSFRQRSNFSRMNCQRFACNLFPAKQKFCPLDQIPSNLLIRCQQLPEDILTSPIMRCADPPPNQPKTDNGARHSSNDSSDAASPKNVWLASPQNDPLHTRRFKTLSWRHTTSLRKDDVISPPTSNFRKCNHVRASSSQTQLLGHLAPDCIRSQDIRANFDSAPTFASELLRPKHR